MVQQTVNLGTGPDTTGSDSLYVAFTKANGNFSELYSPMAVSTETASYTLALADANTVVEGNSASAMSVTVPPNSSVAFPIGTWVEVFQYGAGQVTIVAGAGVTIRTPSTLILRTQYSSASLRKRATNEWALTGDLA